MKNNFIITVVLSTLLLVACNKNDKKHFSTWTINGESFSTDDIEVAVGKAKCGISSKDDLNRFSLGFDFGGPLPTSGTFKITATETNGDPTLAGLTFYYNGKFYIKSKYVVAIITASSNDKKASYKLPITWYASYENPTTDSLQVSGVFNEP